MDDGLPSWSKLITSPVEVVKRQQHLSFTQPTGSNSVQDTSTDLAFCKALQEEKKKRQLRRTHSYLHIYLFLFLFFPHFYLLLFLFLFPPACNFCTGFLLFQTSHSYSSPRKRLCL